MTFQRPYPEITVSLSIAQRILLGFATVTLMMVALGVYAIIQLSSAREATDKIGACRKDLWRRKLSS